MSLTPPHSQRRVPLYTDAPEILKKNGSESRTFLKFPGITISDIYRFKRTDSFILLSIHLVKITEIRGVPSILTTTFESNPYNPVDHLIIRYLIIVHYVCKIFKICKTNKTFSDRLCKGLFNGLN